MSTIDSSFPTPSTDRSSSVTEGLSADQMGRDTFLKLLVTQMKYQDPLSPMENTEFTSQLAQFSSLDQLTTINSNLGDLQSAQNLGIKSGLSNMLGREVMADGNVITMDIDGTNESLNFTLSDDADLVVVDIANQRGEVVNKILLNNKSAGANSLIWNGSDGNGNPMPAGKYYFSVTALDVDERPISSTTQVRGIVEGLSYNDGNPHLIVEGANIPLEDIQQVYN